MNFGTERLIKHDTLKQLYYTAQVTMLQGSSNNVTRVM